MNNDLISRSALNEAIDVLQWYSIHNGEFIAGAGLTDESYYKESDISELIKNAPSVPPGTIREDMYKELERLKRMDCYIMYYEVGDYHFEYHEYKDNLQGITQFENGVFVYHYSIAEPMNHETFEKFCEEVVEKENNRGMDNKQSDKA